MTVLPSQYADPFTTAASQDDLLSHETATSKVAFDELRVEVAVIGAGVVGLAVSRRLAAEDGRKVLIIETGAPTFGTSMANAGHVAGSYVLPFTRPGVVRSGLASLLRHDGAFALDTRRLGIVVPWLVGFVRSCSEENVRPPRSQHLFASPTGATRGSRSSPLPTRISSCARAGYSRSTTPPNRWKRAVAVLSSLRSWTFATGKSTRMMS